MVDEHTPEPWSADWTKQQGTVVGSMWEKDSGLTITANPSTNENARRIVACVNACAGIPTAALEHAAKTYRIDADRLWRMEKLFKAAFKGVTEQ